MKIEFYSIAKGLESRFDILSKPWFYRSKYESWSILRLFGIYIWFYPKVWIGKKK